MPCNSDYLEQTQRERLLQNTAKLLCFVYTKQKREIPKRLLKASDNYYCSDDYVAELCETLRKMRAPQREKIVYDAHNPSSRKLADWWEDHQRADSEREKSAHNTHS